MNLGRKTNQFTCYLPVIHKLFLPSTSFIRSRRGYIEKIPLDQIGTWQLISISQIKMFM